MPHPATFHWLRVRSTPENAEADQWLLMEAGALGTEEEEGPECVLKACFEGGNALSSARESFAERVLDWGESPWEDWDRSWRERQTPVEVTPLLTVCPPWVASPEGIKYVIRLEAKMAFGTGSHESTRIAALLMEKLDLHGKTVLDVGTGTGILAIYAAMRGARLASGFDIDPVAGPCLRENLAENPPPSGTSVLFHVGTLESLRPEIRFDVIVVNMIRTETWPYLDALLARLAPNGLLLFSGQRVDDQPQWHPWIAAHHVTVAEEITLGEWWGFAASRQSREELRITN